MSESGLEFSMRFLTPSRLRYKYLCSFTGGILYALGFPSIFGETLFFGPIVGFALLSIQLDWSNEHLTLKKRLLILLIFCTGYYLGGYYWIPKTIQEFGQIPFPLNQLLGLFFPFFICPQYIVYVLLRQGFQSKFNNINVQYHTLFYATLLVILEQIIPQQFPAHMGHCWLIFSPYLVVAKFFGAPFFSFLNYWMALSLANKVLQGKIYKSAFITTFLVLIINLLYPIQEISLDKEVKTINTRIVQANIGNFEKIQAEKGLFDVMKEVMEYYLRQSHRATSADLDLIVWPETAYPSHLKSTSILNNKSSLPRKIVELTQQMNSQLIFGGYDNVAPYNKYYFETTANSVFYVNRNGRLKNIYHKILLIPFGETLPFGFLNKYFARYIPNVSYFAKGKKHNLITLDNQVKVATPICYEILFSSFIGQFFKGDQHPDLLINLTNDSWYGEFPEPHQHKFLAKWRAVEFAVPIIRSTNTGITSVIYPNAKESPHLKWKEREILDLKLDLNVNNNPTIFAKYGLLASLFAIFIIFISVYLKNLFRTKTKFE